MPVKYKNVKWCDKCSRKFVGAGKVRRLKLSSAKRSGAVNLCRGCWSSEMTWRRKRNKTLTGSAKFPIRKFPK